MVEEKRRFPAKENKNKAKSPKLMITGFYTAISGQTIELNLTL
jgi:hypothetical protein